MKMLADYSNTLFALENLHGGDGIGMLHRLSWYAHGSQRRRRMRGPPTTQPTQMWNGNTSGKHSRPLRTVRYISQARIRSVPVRKHAPAFAMRSLLFDLCLCLLLVLLDEQFGSIVESCMLCKRKHLRSNGVVMRRITIQRQQNTRCARSRSVAIDQ